MANVKVDRDIIAPHPTREGTGHLVAREGMTVDEAVLRGLEAGVPKGAVVSSSTLRGADPTATTTMTGPADQPMNSYGSMKLDDLKALAEDRGLDVDGNTKAAYIDALEADDDGE